MDTTNYGYYDPDGDSEWFPPPIYKNPLDSMPIARNHENPRPEEEIADAYASRHESSPKFEKSAEEIVTMHEKMYRMATKNGTHTLGGGSENLNSR